MSTLTMNSRSANASASWLEFGVDSIGLPPTVTRQRTRPAPGVRISSARSPAGNSPGNLGVTAHPRVPAPDPEPGSGAGPAASRRTTGDRHREHRSTRPIEVAGQHVDHVDEPRSGRPELGRGRADPAVHRGRRGGRQLACEPADRRRIDAGRGRDGLRRERDECGTDVAETGEVCCDVRTWIGETFVEQRVGDRGQQERVRSGADREPLVGLLGGAAAPRIDHHELAATRLHRLDPPREVGRGAQAPIRRVRIGAEHDQEVGAVEVGNRDGDRRSEHVPGRHVAGHLVDRRRAVALPCAETGHQGPGERHRREAVRRRVAEVHGECVAPVPLDHAAEAVLDGRPRLVPRHFDVHAVALDERSPQPIRILVELTQRRTLRADEALREHVVAVAADPCDLLGTVRVTGNRDLEPAARFAERTRAERDSSRLSGVADRHRPRLARATVAPA